MRVVSLLVVAALALPGPAAAVGPDRGRLLRQYAKRGFELARRHCAPCHAVGPIGTSPVGGAPPFRDLHQDYPVADLIGAISEGMPTGHPAMPRFHLRFKDQAALIAYVRSLEP